MRKIAITLVTLILITAPVFAGGYRHHNRRYRSTNRHPQVIQQPRTPRPRPKIEMPRTTCSPAQVKSLREQNQKLKERTKSQDETIARLEAEKETLRAERERLRTTLPSSGEQEPGTTPPPRLLARLLGSMLVGAIFAVIAIAILYYAKAIRSRIVLAEWGVSVGLIVGLIYFLLCR